MGTDAETGGSAREPTDARDSGQMHPYLHHAAAKATALQQELESQAEQLRKAGMDPAPLLAAARSAGRFAEAVAARVDAGRD